MDQWLPDSDPDAVVQRRRPETARLAAPDWVFSAVVHLMLVALLLAAKAGPGGGAGGGRGRGDGGDGFSERWIEAQMGSEVDGSPPAQLALQVVADAKPLIAPAPFPELAQRPLAAVPAATETYREIEQTNYVPPSDTVIPSPVAATASGTSTDRQSGAGGGLSGAGPGSGGGGDGSPGEGGEGRGGTSLFGIRDAGERFVYVIDRSSSMAHYGKFAAARRELAASLAQLDETLEFQVLVYNQEIQPANRRSSGGLLRATLINKNQTLKQLRIVLPEGGTQHLSALQSALQLGPTVVYFLTDAEDPGLTPAYISDLARKLRGRTRIHCIQLGETPGRAPTDGNWLQQLAEATGGEYLHVPTDDLGAVHKSPAAR